MYVKQAQEICCKVSQVTRGRKQKCIFRYTTTLKHDSFTSKKTIDSKGSLCNVMNFIYLQLHPRLIDNYNISWYNNDNILYHITF